MKHFLALFVILLLALSMMVSAQTANIVFVDDDSEVLEGLVEEFVGLEPNNINGQIIHLYGQVLNTAGEAVPNAVVEIWQTDANGAYDHPRDPSTNERDTSFQFFGAASTNEQGWYIFRTLLPGLYEPRPRHIHFKVKQDGRELLTSQFYFSEDIAQVEGERMFQAVGDSGDLLLLQLYQSENSDSSNNGLWANGQIVVNVASTGNNTENLSLTPSQGEGPYYPVVSVSEFDNDLLTLE